MNGNVRIKSLDSVRGLAALSVLFFHCYTIAFTFKQQVDILISDLGFPWNIPLVLGVNLLSSGRAAVMVFFVLSGFVLTLSLLNNKQSYKKFLVARIFRIYPVLFLSVVMAFGLHYVIGNNPLPPSVHVKWYQFHVSVPTPLTFQDLIGHLALTGITPNHIYLDTPLWSLVHEMRISLILPLLVSLLLLKNKPAIIIVLGLIISIFGEAIADFLIMSKSVHKPNGFPEETLLYSLMKTVYYLVFFIAGILMAINREKITTNINKFTPLLKALMVVTSVIFIVYHDSSQTMFVDYLRGIGAAMLIALAFSWKEFEKILEAPVLQWLGRVSYSLYLVHWLIIYSIFELFGNYLPLWMNISITVTLSFICAHIMSKFVEYPCINLGRKILNKMQ